MSLEVEGKGATCVECGVFDFLPWTCPRCCGIYCRTHAYTHHTPTAPPLTGDSERPWCTPSPAVGRDVGEAEVGDGCPDPLTAAPAIRCALCSSTWCVLVPCPHCGYNYCAEHRFHGHEEDGGVGISGTSGRVRRSRSSAAQGDADSGPGRQDFPNALAAACAPYTTQAPLSLAPPGYRSRMLDMVALLCRRAAPGCDAAAGPTSPWQLAVCSLSAATEVSVGQLLQRCLGELGLSSADGRTSAMTDPALQALSRESAVFRLSPSTGGDGRVVVQLHPVSLADLTRAAFQPSDAMVLRIGGGGGTGAEGQDVRELTEILSQLLRTPPLSGGGSSDDGEVAALARDARVRAVFTRLRLRAAPSSLTAPHEAPPPTESPPPREGAVDSADVVPAVARAPSEELTHAAPGGASWPFRQPPPLTAFTFRGSRASPLGGRHVSAASAPAGRVVVAVLVEDVGLPAVAGATAFVLALGKGWVAGKVRERVREEAAAAAGVQLQALPAGGGEVFYLGSSAPAGASGAADVTGISEPLAARMASTPLRDGDVLFVGAAAACGPGSALAAEVAEMHARTGKPLAAQRLELMKKCTVM